jgi:hypothetical protein
MLIFLFKNFGNFQPNCLCRQLIETEQFYRFIPCRSMNPGKEVWREMRVAGPSNTIRFVHLTWKIGIWVYMVIFMYYQSALIVIVFPNMG